MTANINLVSLIDRFGDDDKCREALEKIRWPDGVGCWVRWFLGALLHEETKFSRAVSGQGPGMQMEASEQKASEVVAGLLRVAEFEDEISELAGEHRRVRFGVLVMSVILVGSAVGMWVIPGTWVFAVLGVILFTPWAIRASRAHMLGIVERRGDLLLELEEVKTPGRLQSGPPSDVDGA